MTATSRKRSQTSRRVSIPVAHGRLEGLLAKHATPVAAAVMCHPHPQHGGTMDNNVVYRAARALGACGLTVLRFNFRGVGASTGAYGEGAGEIDDAIAALDFLQVAVSAGTPLWMAGFSFGARVGLRAGAEEPRIAKLLGIGLALTLFDFGFLRDSPKPKGFVQAENDEYGAADAVRPLVESLREPRRLEVVPGATHLFPGHLDAVEKAVAEVARWLISVPHPVGQAGAGGYE